MNNLRTAAQQALEALENCRIEYDYHGNPIDEENAALIKAIASLRAALAEPHQEPVASLMTHVQSGDMEVAWNDDGFDREMWHETPLYAAPPQRKPLREGEVIAQKLAEPHVWVCPEAADTHRYDKPGHCEDCGKTLIQMAEPVQEPVAWDYGSIEFGFTFAGLPLTDGDKRLAALLTQALGNDHPAFQDLVALFFAARGRARGQA